MNRGERWARIALFALMLAAPVVYLARSCFANAPALPEPTPPSWTHLIVVTVGGWPDLAQSLAEPELAAFDRRASRVNAVFAPSAARAASAASLWTGRYPRSHGVLANDRALGPGVWTLASAARAAGTRTGAFLQEPFVSATGIEGFETVLEDPGDAPALVDSAAAFLEETRRERVLVWLHFADAGEGAAGVGGAIARLEQALAETDRLPEAAIVLAVLCRGLVSAAPKGPLESIDALGAPLWVALPGALHAGRRGDARLSLVDLTGLLQQLLALPSPPDASLSSRSELFANALRGGGGTSAILVQGDVDEWRRGEERVVFDAAAGSARAERRSGGKWTELAGEEAAKLLAEAKRDAQQALATRTPARAAMLPPGDWPEGWR